MCFVEPGGQELQLVSVLLVASQLPKCNICLVVRNMSSSHVTAHACHQLVKCQRDVNQATFAVKSFLLFFALLPKGKH